jgi:hypothetical protein
MARSMRTAAVDVSGIDEPADYAAGVEAKASFRPTLKAVECTGKRLSARFHD